MCSGAIEIAEYGIRRKLGAALGARPPFSSSHERPADSSPPHPWNDIPALQIRDTIRHALFRIAPNRQFREADQRRVVVHGYKYSQRHPQLAGKEAIDLSFMRAGRPVRPKRDTHRQPAGGIARHHRPDDHFPRPTIAPAMDAIVLNA